MAPRAKPVWGFFVGGPLDGQRMILAPSERAGVHLRYTPAPAGMRVPHEYLATAETRKGGPHEGDARVVRFVRSLPEEPEPPVQIGHGSAR